MALEDASTKDLRRELNRREDAERARQWEAFRVAHPCPECGCDPVSFNSELVDEHVQAPRDPDGRPMLYMPYEAGEVIGGVYETTLVCVNGHETRNRVDKFFEKPIGPPSILGRGSR